MCKAFSSSELKIIALLAQNGALSLASRLRSLAFNALVLAPRLRTLALGVVSENDAESATLLAHRDALVLASRAGRLALPGSAVDVSKTVVSSLLAPRGALSLASWQRSLALGALSLASSRDP